MKELIVVWRHLGDEIDLRCVWEFDKQKFASLLKEARLSELLEAGLNIEHFYELSKMVAQLILPFRLEEQDYNIGLIEVPDEWTKQYVKYLLSRIDINKARQRLVDLRDAFFQGVDKVANADKEPSNFWNRVFSTLDLCDRDPIALAVAEVTDIDTSLKVLDVTWEDLRDYHAVYSQVKKFLKKN